MSHRTDTTAKDRSSNNYKACTPLAKKDGRGRLGSINNKNKIHYIFNYCPPPKQSALCSQKRHFELRKRKGSYLVNENDPLTAARHLRTVLFSLNQHARKYLSKISTAAPEIGGQNAKQQAEMDVKDVWFAGSAVKRRKQLRKVKIRFLTGACSRVQLGSAPLRSALRPAATADDLPHNSPLHSTKHKKVK